MEFLFDFPCDRFTIWTASYCLIFFIIILCQNYKKGLHGHIVDRSYNYKKSVLVIIAFFIITHCKHGDFFHFMEYVHDYDFTEGVYNYGEPIYVQIGKIVHRNYFLFRTIVFGGAFYLFCRTLKRFGLPLYHAVIFLVAVYVQIFAYARVTAAMSLYFFGLSFICVPLKNKLLSHIVGASIIALSIFFHNSAIIMVLSTLFLFFPIRKWTLLLALISVVLLTQLLLSYFYDLLYLGLLGDDISGRMSVYSEREMEVGIVVKVTNLIQYYTFYAPFYFVTTKFITYKQLSVKYKPFFLVYKIVFGLLLLSFSFLMFGSEFITFYYRIMYMTMIPLVILVMKFRTEGLLTNRQFVYCYVPGIICQSIIYLYDIYVANYYNYF